jgi:hypothetical protein
MKKSSVLTQLAIAGIAAGLVSVAPVHASHHGDKSDSSKTEKFGCKGKSGCKGMGKVKSDSSCKGHTSCKGASGCQGKDSASLGKKIAADSASAKAVACKGHNSCKGQGGCAMSEKDLKAAAKKMGMPANKAGKAHSCKGKNECKGLGGCKM